jgi:AraC family transcriptional regulator of adaptative response / DNA-3-methyladenine glycosylase II
VSVGGKAGWLGVEPDASRPALVATLPGALLGGPAGSRGITALVARLRRLFDLDARPADVDGQLARDPALGRLVRATPGLRVPGAFDGFETAVRAVLGQQVTVKGATTLAGRLAARFGAPARTPIEGLDRLFPTPARLAAATAGEIAALGMPRARARALRHLARAAKAGLRLEPGTAVEGTMARLAELPGFGDWTTQVVAMRALRWPDAFPAADLGVLRALRVRSARAALARAEAWRPWRAYATMYLWSGGGT